MTTPEELELWWARLTEVEELMAPGDPVDVDPLERGERANPRSDLRACWECGRPPDDNLRNGRCRSCDSRWRVQRPVAELSEPGRSRAHEIRRLFAEGLTRREIAARLGVSVSAVSVDLRRPP